MEIDTYLRKHRLEGTRNASNLSPLESNDSNLKPPHTRSGVSSDKRYEK